MVVDMVQACGGVGLVGELPSCVGFLGGRKVEVLRDTGSNMVLVHRSLVAEEQLTGDNCTVYLADNTQRSWPEARIDLHTPYLEGIVSAYCVDQPLFDVMIGNVPGVRTVKTITEPPQVEQLDSTAQGGEPSAEGVAGVVTRGQTRQARRSRPPLKVPECMDKEEDKMGDELSRTQPCRAPAHSEQRTHSQGMDSALDSGAYPVIVRPSHNPDCFELRNDNLERLLTNPDVADLPVVVLSVAGGFRLGKSFLLGFCIRYLEHLEMSSYPSGWMDKDDIPLTGFSWKYGSKRHTTGIHLWGKVFKIKTPKHGLVAVVLMDTEGAFDNTSTLEGNVTIFSVSMLLSSVQVYNLTKQITQSDLEHLKLFAEYASMARSKEGQGNEVFQKLLFLIRDWKYPGEKPFGLEGGQELLDPWLERNHTLPREVYELRENIISSFAEVRCFLLPRPGDAIEKSSFDGKLHDLSTDFKFHIKDLVPFLLSPETVVPKKINGRIVTCKELVCMFQAYFSVFNHKELPQPLSIFNATAFIHNKRIMDKIVGKYDTGMEAIVHSHSDTDIQMEHDRLTRECLSVFQNEQKMGKHDAELRELLIKDLNDHYDVWRHARDMWRKYTHDKEHRFGEEREKPKRDFQESLEKLMEEERKKYQENMDSMARRHSLDMEQMRKAMQTASLKNRIWDIGLTIANTFPGLCQAGVGLFKTYLKYR
ncbi:atlastin-2-like isoform X3 [Ornithodoros turicata]|uniref:atlastin-2-like isoform X3 n=1 Tax=Ornithodoros turicata TaxID=34597 RepID=UPI00313A49AC